MRRLAIQTILIIMLFLPSPSAAADTLTLAIHPYLPAGELMSRFTPMAEYLSRKVGVRITCRISSNYKSHIEAAGRDRADIFFIGPASYVYLTRKYGPRPILSRLEVRGSPYFRGVIIARKDSSISSLTDLAGKRFAFGDPNSTMSHLVPLYVMTMAGITPDRLSGYDFLNSHPNVALGILMGDFDAGAVKEEIFEEYRSRGLKAIAYTPEIPEHLFISSSTMDGYLRFKIKKAMLSMKDDEDGRAALSFIKKGVTALVDADDSDYDQLRSILEKIRPLKAPDE